MLGLKLGDLLGLRLGLKLVDGDIDGDRLGLKLADGDSDGDALGNIVPAFISIPSCIFMSASVTELCFVPTAIA